MKNSNVRTAVSSLKNVHVLTLMAMLAAMSIIFGKFLAFNAGPLRISFENLPILMAGMFLGAPAGFLTGITADIVGCLMVGYSINPIITIGAGCIGLIAGILFHVLRDASFSRLPEPLTPCLISIMGAHFIGSMIIKSAGLVLYYHYTFVQVAWRVPTYLAIGTAEALIITALLSNKAFTDLLSRIKR